MTRWNLISPSVMEGSIFVFIDDEQEEPTIPLIYTQIKHKHILENKNAYNEHSNRSPPIPIPLSNPVRINKNPYTSK